MAVLVGPKVHRITLFYGLLMCLLILNPFVICPFAYVDSYCNIGVCVYGFLVQAEVSLSI